jgi:hypothetical protein
VTGPTSCRTCNSKLDILHPSTTCHRLDTLPSCRHLVPPAYRKRHPMIHDRDTMQVLFGLNTPSAVCLTADVQAQLCNPTNQTLRTTHTWVPEGQDLSARGLIPPNEGRVLGYTWWCTASIDTHTECLDALGHKYGDGSPGEAWHITLGWVGGWMDGWGVWVDRVLRQGLEAATL